MSDSWFCTLSVSGRHPWCILTQFETRSVFIRCKSTCMSKETKMTLDMSGLKHICKYWGGTMKLRGNCSHTHIYFFVEFDAGPSYLLRRALCNFLKKKKNFLHLQWLCCVVLEMLPPCISQACFAASRSNCGDCMISRDHVSCIQINVESKSLLTRRASILKKS